METNGVDFLRYEYVADDNWKIEYRDERQNNQDYAQLTVYYLKNYGLQSNSVSIFQGENHTKEDMNLQETAERIGGVSASMNRLEGMIRVYLVINL